MKSVNLSGAADILNAALIAASLAVFAARHVGIVVALFQVLFWLNAVRLTVRMFSRGYHRLRPEDLPRQILAEGGFASGPLERWAWGAGVLAELYYLFT